MCMSVCLHYVLCAHYVLCMCTLCAMYVPGAGAEQESTSDLLEIRLQIVVSHHMSAQTKALVLCKRNWCSSPLSQLPSISFLNIPAKQWPSTNYSILSRNEILQGFGFQACKHLETVRGNLQWSASSHAYKIFFMCALIHDILKQVVDLTLGDMISLWVKSFFNIIQIE